MDKKSIIGILLIFVVLVLFSVINRPSKKEIELLKHKRDSIALVQAEIAKQLEQEVKTNQASTSADSSAAANTEEELINKRAGEFGVFAPASSGEERLYTLENNLYKLTISNKGGKLVSVELKDYQTYDSLPLILFEGPDTKFGLNFFAQNKSIQTEQLFFTPTFNGDKVVATGPTPKKSDIGDEKTNSKNPGETKSATFRLDIGGGKAIEYVYTLKHNSYMVGFDIKMVGMNDVIASNQPFLNFTWAFKVPRQERISSFGEDRYTNILYKFVDGDLEQLSQTKSDEKSLSTRVKWISFKQLFFNSTLIAKDAFANAQVKSERFKNNPEYLSDFSADIAIPYEAKPNEDFGMQFYFGPNHYKTVNQYDLGLERLVYLGYAIVRPVNKYIVIPVFNFLREFISNFGIIILLSTIFIKLIIFPFSYKSFLSQAKMKVLKPEIDEINLKYGSDKMMERQQATMALYKKVGVNPMGGCLPMLLQFPFLIAMFFFFPTSIELRQQGFLWAHDLSTYDSILKLPFNIPMYGNHVSLFCLLMTATTLISTHLTSQTTANTGMPGMKTMMYIMPIFFMFLLNSYSSGLSYYYFLANVITIGQTYLMRRFIDEEKIRAQLQVNKKKPVKKSNFQKRLEEMAKQKGMQLPK
jgi:YidC/Oxa1 family membrane protein insertase